MLAGYDHLLAAARRLQWDAEAIDLSADTASVARLDRSERAVLNELVAGFQLAEHVVAAELAPYIAATDDPLARECFAVQAADERRHARFFDRVAGEVLRLDPATAEMCATPGIRTLFGDTLPACARGLAHDAGRLADAVGLYHLVIEGIVFTVGQAALLELAGAGDPARLPGIAAGVTRVQADERWHVGLGVLALQELGDTPLDIEAPARAAIAAWGPRVATPARTAHAFATHARRLKIVGALESAR